MEEGQIDCGSGGIKTYEFWRTNQKHQKERKTNTGTVCDPTQCQSAAVSNWENNKNLPDIGMLILISNVFHISLDALIKGDDQMNNMTEKVIQDGSETKKARYNMITSIIGGVLFLIGVMLFIIKGLSVEYIDAQGILHENFFLIPLGFASIFCGLILFITIVWRVILSHFRTKEE